MPWTCVEPAWRGRSDGHGPSLTCCVQSRTMPVTGWLGGRMFTSPLLSSLPCTRDQNPRKAEQLFSANTDCAPSSSQTAVSMRDKVLSPCLSCLGSNCFVLAPSSLCCPSLRWRSGYVYIYSTKIKRHKNTQNAADSEQLIRVPDAGKTRMLEGWSGSSGCDGLCCLWSLLPEVTLLLCVCCSSLCSLVPRNYAQGCMEC